jgi:hypothetical protein
VHLTGLCLPPPHVPRKMKNGFRLPEAIVRTNSSLD